MMKHLLITIAICTAFYGIYGQEQPNPAEAPPALYAPVSSPAQSVQPIATEAGLTGSVVQPLVMAEAAPVTAAEMIPAPESETASPKAVNIYFGEKIFRFSDYARKSRVSVFLVTASYCTPCHILQNQLFAALKQNKQVSQKVNIYLVNVPDVHNPDDQAAYNSLGYSCFKNIDELPAILPTTVIFSPTQNQYAKFQGNEFEQIYNCIATLAGYCK